MKYSISAVLALATLGTVSAAQSQAHPIPVQGELHHATLDMTTGEVTRSGRNQKSTTLTLKYWGTDYSGYYSIPDPGREWLDWGVMPDSTSTGNIMGMFAFGYGTSVLSTWAGGPGASVCVSFYDDAIGWCNESGQGLLPDARFCFTGLPGAIPGVAWGWVVRIPLLDGNEFVQDAGPFGYSMSFFDTLTGPLLCYTGDPIWGREDAFDAYVPDVATGMCTTYWFGGYPHDFSSWYMELWANDDVPPASCSWYCGSGVNHLGFTQTSCARLGGTYQAYVLAAGPNVGATLLGYDAPLLLMTPWGEALVDFTSPAGELLGMPTELGDPAFFDLPVPLDMGLAGVTFYVQAVGFGGGINLHCAWQNTIGS